MQLTNEKNIFRPLFDVDDNRFDGGARYISIVKPGTYIKQFLLRYKGMPLYRYGVVLRMIKDRPPVAEVIFFPHEHPNRDVAIMREYLKFGLYVETIKLELIEILAEPNTV